MLGSFLIRMLILVWGYAYPAFECFKSVEKNKVDVEELRFWCQYWIIIALLTVCERIGDMFISWIPMYGEMKLALIVYLWYPKTKGTAYFYQTLLKPLMEKHETEIDRKIEEYKARAWDLVFHNWQNCTKLGHTSFIQLLQYLAAQSGKVKSPNSHEKAGTANNYESSASPVPPSPTGSPMLKNNKWTPRSPRSLGRSTLNRVASDLPKSHRVKVHYDENAEHFPSTPDTGPETNDISDKLQQARMRLRRSTTIQN